MAYVNNWKCLTKEKQKKFWFSAVCPNSEKKMKTIFTNYKQRQICRYISVNFFYLIRRIEDKKVVFVTSWSILECFWEQRETYIGIYQTDMGNGMKLWLCFYLWKLGMYKAKLVGEETEKNHGEYLMKNLVGRELHHNGRNIT